MRHGQTDVEVSVSIFASGIWATAWLENSPPPPIHTTLAITSWQGTTPWFHRSFPMGTGLDTDLQFSWGRATSPASRVPPSWSEEDLSREVLLGRGLLCRLVLSQGWEETCISGRFAKCTEIG